jgi:hypothetical protein
MSPQAAPKRYRPPQPDANTFDTQEAFLDSLRVIPVDTVDEGDRKCAHCWKRYGESDPGFDNAEDPVRLRCNHVFGEKCLRDLFGLPESVRVNLPPLSYEPGSRGADLGRRLSQWVDHCGVDKGALMLGGNRQKDFTKLLNQLQAHPADEKTLGPYWTTLFLQAMAPRPNVDRVFILENAVVFDVIPARHAAKKSPGPEAQGTPVPASNQLVLGGWPHNPPNFDGAALPPIGWGVPPFYDTTAMTASDSGTSDSSESESPQGDAEGQASVPENPIVNKSASQPASQPNASLTPSAHADSSQTPSPYTTSHGPVGSPKLESSIGATKSPLKSPITDKEFALKLQAQETKLQNALKQLDDPTLFDFLPSNLLSTMTGHFTGVPGLASLPPGAQPSTMNAGGTPASGESHPPKVSNHIMENIFKAKKDAVDKTEQDKSKPGAWKDNMPDISNLDKLVALKKNNKQAEKWVKMAKMGQAAFKAQQVEAEKRAAKIKGIY